MRIEMPVRERELKILDVNLSGKRWVHLDSRRFLLWKSFMYFPASLLIQLTFLFHDELKCAIGGLNEITVDSDIDFSVRKIVIGEVIGKKYV